MHIAQQRNSALTALSLILEDASQRSGTPVEDLIVRSLEFRQRTSDPGPLPPVFLITLGDGLEYLADTQGNIIPPEEKPGDLTDWELWGRFTQTGGIGGWTSTGEASDATLSEEEAAHLRQFLTDSNFFDLPDEVPNGDLLPDQYSLFLYHLDRSRWHMAVETIPCTRTMEAVRTRARCWQHSSVG